MADLPPIPQPYPQLRVGHFGTTALPEGIGTAIDVASTAEDPTGQGAADIHQQIAQGLDAVVFGPGAARGIEPRMLQVLIACEAAAVPTVLRVSAAADLQSPVAAVVSHIAAETEELFQQALRQVGPERAFSIEPTVDAHAVLTEPLGEVASSGPGSALVDITPEKITPIDVTQRRELIAQHSPQAQAERFLQFLGLPVAPEPLVTAVLVSRHAKNLQHSLENLRRQSYARIDPLLVIDPIYEHTARELTADWDIPLRIVVSNPRSTPAEKLNLGVQHAHGELVAVIEETGLYGSHYLGDQVQALQHSGAHLVGRASWLVWDAEKAQLRVHAPKKQLSFDQLPALGTLIFRRETGQALGFIRRIPAAGRSFVEHIRAAGGTVFVSHAYDAVMLTRGQTLEDLEHLVMP